MIEQKDAVLKHHVNMIAWSKTLNNLSSHHWFSPVQENKWSIAEIISHLIPWDEFVLEHRIPYFSSNDSLPNSPDRDAVNERAALEGRSAEKSVTINRFIVSRTKLLECIENISSDLWDKTFRIGETELTVYQYFKGLTEHDTHHKKQIQDSLTKH